ncbi:RNA-binding Nova-2-like isoform X1 isoform B [Chlorella sorokiniana]|uniref:RNA-binding Nova-2-like isoform X1 isoform B n=1 Tax=Chlorella sorokiniana TaxID=3076 RepID=A0A2P6U4P1_CHLSO|nr:RNA-binding Nova-2-like isoform X1 isoform B [Chlorella sorokiniana]|eukprot:PRW61288.1 RNA-binding Nova-2-like isoform X1 isoform B [Chlorella sorokiniana]
METGGVDMDPITVLDGINTQLRGLQVSSLPTSSEPTTPSSESPLSLDSTLREWLTEALATNASNPKVYTKLLVSNAAAGSIIGKAGSNINDVQAKTYARIQLSKANEYFPGTTERTLLVTGRLKQVVAALGLILAKLLREGVAPLSPRSKAAAGLRSAAGSSVSGGPGSEEGESSGEEVGSGTQAPRLLVRLLVPQPLCGVIIGKSGATIRNYATDTGTVIRVTSGEAAQLPTSHRIVTIAGEKEGVLKAIALMVLRQAEDPKFSLYGELPSPAAPSSGVAPHAGLAPLGPLGMPAPFHPGLALPFMPHGGLPSGAGLAPYGLAAGSSMGPGETPFTSLNLMLTEDQAAVLLDQGSRAVMEAEQMTGCRARLEMVDGPRGCFGRLMLAGPTEAVAYAQWLLGQRLSAAASFQMGGTTYYNPYGPAAALPSMAGMPAFGQAPPPGMAPPFGMPGPWAQPAVPAMQQMAAAAMMPAFVRQGSASDASPPSM